MGKVKLASLGQIGVIKDVLAEDLPPEAFTEVRNVR